MTSSGHKYQIQSLLDFITVIAVGDNIVPN